MERHRAGRRRSQAAAARTVPAALQVLAAPTTQLPMLRDVAVNGVPAQQSVPAGQVHLDDRADATIVGTPAPARHQGTRRAPARRVRRDRPRWTPTTGAPRSCSCSTTWPRRAGADRSADRRGGAGRARCRPAPIRWSPSSRHRCRPSSVRLFTLQTARPAPSGGTGRSRADLDASTRADRHAVLDADSRARRRSATASTGWSRRPAQRSSPATVAHGRSGQPARRCDQRRGRQRPQRRAAVRRAGGGRARRWP